MPQYTVRAARMYPLVYLPLRCFISFCIAARCRVKSALLREFFIPLIENPAPDDLRVAGVLAWRVGAGRLTGFGRAVCVRVAGCRGDCVLVLWGRGRCVGVLVV